MYRSFLNGMYCDEPPQTSWVRSVNPQHFKRNYDELFKKIIGIMTYNSIFLPVQSIYGRIILRPHAILLFGSDAESIIRTWCTEKYINANVIFVKQFISIRPNLNNKVSREILKVAMQPIYNNIKRHLLHTSYSPYRKPVIEQFIIRGAKYLIDNDIINCQDMFVNARQHAKCLVFDHFASKCEFFEPIYDGFANVALRSKDLWFIIRCINRYTILMYKYSKCNGYNSAITSKGTIKLKIWKTHAEQIIKKKLHEKFTYNFENKSWILNDNGNDRKNISIFGHNKIVRYYENVDDRPRVICKIQKKKCHFRHCKQLYINKQFGKGGYVLNKLCSKCKSVYYCCVKHQKLDWNSHKNNCCVS
eukprot:495266_1